MVIMKISVISKEFKERYLENSIDLGEDQLRFRMKCFKEFESLMKGVNNP